MSLNIQWSPATEDEAFAARAFLTQLLPTNKFPAHPHVLFRLAQVSFYPRLVLIEAADLGPEGDAQAPPWHASEETAQKTTQPAKMIYAIGNPDKDRVELVNFTNQPIYTLNSVEEFDLKRTNATEYLAFFFSTVAGPYGFMSVIETLSLPPGADEEPGTKEQLATLGGFIPPVVVSEDDTGFRIQAALLFQGAVFRTLVLISPTGEVTVEEHAMALASGSEEPDGDDNEESGEEP